MKTALIVGASRNIGLEIVRGYLARGWRVIGTVRGSNRTPLHELADSAQGRLVIARADITEGTIAVMSSRQGSISMNTRGGHEVYRASKSALNQLMRSYAARTADNRTLLLVHPGWVQTELGGPGAQLTVQESAEGVVKMVEAQAGTSGLQFRSYLDEVVAW